MSSILRAVLQKMILEEKNVPLRNDQIFSCFAKNNKVIENVYRNQNGGASPIHAIYVYLILVMTVGEYLCCEKGV